MLQVSELIIAFLISLTVSIVVTPLIIKLAKKYKAVDAPDNNRKLHNGSIPTMGGLAIFIGAAAGFVYLQPSPPEINAIIIGAFIIIITGILDDIFNIRALYKLLGQLAAASVVVSSGLVIEKLTIPFMGTIFLTDFVGVIITLIWILAASNAINLIDGLDGLAAGVSAIALSSILVMAIVDASIVVLYLCVILVGSCLGFLFYNFYPAKIFMGDTGALFLGYSMAIVAMLGLFKNVAFFSFIVPLIVIAVPILDTILAIIRRSINHQGIATADRKHVHYQLLKMGYSHPQAVLIIYGFSIFFGFMAITFNSATLTASFFTFTIIILGVQLVAEIAGMTLDNRKPLLASFRKVFRLQKLNKQ